MSGNTEPSSNSMKFAPMPMSALLAQLMPLEEAPARQDADYQSADDSDSSLVVDSIKKKPECTNFNKLNNVELFSSTPKVPLPKNMKEFISEKKIHNETNKENVSNQSMSHNWKYPHNESHVQKFVNKPVPHNVKQKSDMKRSILTPHNKPSSSTMNPPHRSTPEIAKLPSSSQKNKIATPKIKSGIRHFTPGSGRRSNKKTPQRKVVQLDNKESIRCLFPDNPMMEEVSAPTKPAPTEAQSVPETPMGRKPMPASYTATPSYPQGLVKNQSKVQFKTTVIKGKKYMYIKKLGTGGSSEVYKVLEVGSSNEYAVKCVNLATDPELARGYVNEVRLLRELQNSDRVIRLYDYDYDRENKFLRVVLEVGETDLSSLLRARGAGLPPGLVLHYWEEMLHSVRHIHTHGVIHADLKPANFLLVMGRLKLIDFGIASSISSDATSVVRSQATGTYSYISPEALMGGAGGYEAGDGNAPIKISPCCLYISSDATSVVRSQATGTYSYISPEALMGGAGGYEAGDGNAPIKISFRSDVWSLGCILYSMVYGRTPFSHIPNLAKLAAILDPQHRIDYPPVEHLPQSLVSALKWCLTYNARSRPTVADLLAIPYWQPACKCSCTGQNN